MTKPTPTAQGICTECRNPCTVRQVDNGIGAYEFWGALGVDHQYEAESSCCNAPAEDECGNEITTNDLGVDPDYYHEGD